MRDMVAAMRRPFVERPRGPPLILGVQVAQKPQRLPTILLRLEGGKAFEEMLPHNHTLRHLDLRENKLSPNAINSLKGAAALRPDLEVLA